MLFGNEDRQRNGNSEVQTPEIAARQEPLQHAVAPYSLASTLEAGDLDNAQQLMPVTAGSESTPAPGTDPENQ